MPRIILVAATTGYQTRSFANAAKRLGVDVVLATDRCHLLDDPWRDNAVAIRFDEPEAGAELLAVSTVDGIVAVADRPTMLAAHAAQRLGVCWHPPHAVAACRDKHRARALFAGAGLPAPKNFCVPLERDPREVAGAVSFPCVLKPLGLSASRGVIRANDIAEFVAAFGRIRKILHQVEIRQSHETWHDAIQVEEYIEGREFAVEGLMTHGELTVLAIFDKPDPLTGPFFEETIYVTPSRESVAIQAAIIETTRQAAAALGLYHGPIHAEMRVNASGVYMLEIAARPIGGLCARALRFAGGISLEDLVILHAIGAMPGNLKLYPAAMGVMMIPVPGAGIFEAAEGIEEAMQAGGIDDVVITAKTGQKLIPLPEGGGYTGFIFASGEEPAGVEQSLREAHARLRFKIFAALEVMAPRT